MQSDRKQDDDPWTLAMLPQFLDLTASRQIEIEIERGNLEAGLDPASAVHEICKTAHKISGTAASFGFAALGKQAQVIESLCKRFGGLPGGPGRNAVKDELFAALDLLSQEMDVALVASA